MARESRSESKQRIPTPLTELVEKNIQEQRRWQAVLAAIPALIERKETINENEIAMYACDIADAVVREFEKRKGE